MSGFLRIDDRAAYLAGPVNLGLILGGNGRAAAVDSGIDGEAARRLRKAAADNGFQIAAVINTHHHADHTGGNGWLCEKTGARVFCSYGELPLVADPEQLPTRLFSGAAPPPQLQVRFLQAKSGPKPSPLDEQALAWLAGQLELPMDSLEVLTLPGHSPGQIGLRCGQVIFSGDAYFDPEVLAKHRIPYLVDPGAYLESLKRLEARAREVGATVIPGHGTPWNPAAAGSERVAGVAWPSPLDANRRLVCQIAEQVLEIAGEAGQPKETEEIYTSLMDRLGFVPPDPSMYYLSRAAVQAWLSWLVREGRLAPRTEGCRLLWQKTN